MASEQVFQQPRPGSTGSTFNEKCVHFNGVNFTNKSHKCKAGVVIADVAVKKPFKYQYDGKGPVYTSGYSLPCLKHSDPTGVCESSKRKFPTPEEIENHKQEVAKVLGGVMIARAAITAKEGKKRGVAGRIDCPVCKTGKLSYSIAGCNGHIHAACSTKGCVRWME